ncbi:MAG TPA: hypothetical protein VD993_11540 [Chitinophagaceae bacterium]|nr:hypothetical protein [Chitinophagaceae bacterium]
MRKIKLFLLICIITGVLIFSGSVLGNGLIPWKGIFVGAILGGIGGILIATVIAAKVQLISRQSRAYVIGFSLAGFLPAILISLNNLGSPVILVLSTGLVGLGAVLGDYLKNRNPKL